ncbi:1-phosphofructokinase family hexose kinase [Amycolatopsis sp. YIM 10]|uniref:1-phosphofructokinase family hexose kinase n=1 Tax=Amycolatopsis sp. YIM 10 TaxID=2653857 RepID=UPI0012901A97|nr:1-phosphofructokinase family hexose kinase [Amycolatopsis sp. YIM 10]QFU90012.1 Tagatose-6-phosphate kinase [Amycolatopsis sp. YIM 10]
MIVTVTANPALDVTYRVGALEPGAVIRPAEVRKRAGGKGFNVARVLHALGREVLALGPVGGADATLIREDLAAAGIPHRLTGIAGVTRRTTALVAPDAVTLVNEPGPRLSEVEWGQVAGEVARQLEHADVLVCSGSLPPGAPSDGYAHLIGLARKAGVPVVLDTSGEALREGIRAGPDVVKPNADELRELTDDPHELRARGAGAVLVSLGADGMLAATPDGTWLARPSRKLGGNTTGAGDAAVAGIALNPRQDWPAVLRQAVALSAAAVLGPLAGDVDLDHYRRELGAVTVEETHATGVNG